MVDFIPRCPWSCIDCPGNVSSVCADVCFKFWFQARTMLDNTNIHISNYVTYVFFAFANIQCGTFICRPGGWWIAGANPAGTPSGRAATGSSTARSWQAHGCLEAQTTRPAQPPVAIHATQHEGGGRKNGSGLATPCLQLDVASKHDACNIHLSIPVETFVNISESIQFDSSRSICKQVDSSRSSTNINNNMKPPNCLEYENKNMSTVQHMFPL